jgi:ferredoxin-NADP reductase
MISSQKPRDRYLATVKSLERLNEEMLAVKLNCPDYMHYKAGQYLKVFMDEQTTRCYSLASAPNIDAELQLHIRKSGSNGSSCWFHEQLQVGDQLHISPPQGTCFYLPVDMDQPLLFISTGAGLAPHYGMLRSALRHGHRGSIYLYHGVRYPQEFYLAAQLRELVRFHANLRYVPCVSQGNADGYSKGRSLDIALRDTPLSKNLRVYLSGRPVMVLAARDALVNTGLAPDHIFSDFPLRPAALSQAA